MKIIPAVDIKDGKAVRLYKGSFESKEVVGEDPELIVEEFIRKGINEIHIVDLDGALGNNIKNREIIKNICSIKGGKIQLGGGIKTLEDFKWVLDLGVSKIVVGSMIIKNFEIFQYIARHYKENLVAGVDISKGKLMVSGWLEGSKISHIEISKQLEELKVKRMVVTDISRDGTMNGVNIDICREIKKFYSGEIICSGGVASTLDFNKAKNEGMDGVIVGKAFYKGKITFEDMAKAGEIYGL